MPSIFSTYSTGENRVTASCLAVLRSLSIDRMERLIGALLEQSEFQLIRFENQPSKGGAGVPDAIIQSSLRLLIETKTQRNTVKKDQVVRHLLRLDDASESNLTLLMLTPDDVRPKALDAVNDDRVAWASFTTLDQAINELLEDPKEVVSEREAFLLRELQSMLEAEGLTASLNDTVIVAARNAWPEYQELHAYVCQPNRSFQVVNRMGFYSQGMVYPLIPRITASFDDVVMEKGAHKGSLGDLVSRLIDEGYRTEGERFKVMMLSSPESPDTITLNQPIPNDKRSKSGKPTAFTMGQRYVPSDALLIAETTSELDQTE
ncbi:MAG: restriction endonuclease [bacterium]|nr:restriction endonuclease [bacterium]